MHGRKERWGNVRERVHMEDQGVEGRIILKCVFKKLDGAMDVIDLV
jgi:hypothetical protein